MFVVLNETRRINNTTQAVFTLCSLDIHGKCKIIIMTIITIIIIMIMLSMTKIANTFAIFKFYYSNNNSNNNDSDDDD